MRKVTIKVIFEIYFVPKGSKGDKIKEKLNEYAEKAFENQSSVIRFEMESSKRSYKSKSGGLVSLFTVYVSDDVNFNNGEVDPVNDFVWSSIRERESLYKTNKTKKWSLINVTTENVEHITSSVDKEERVRVDLNEISRYTNQDNPSPEYKTTRTLYPSEFDEAFKSIMEELRTRLKLTDENYRMTKSIVDQKPTEWDCEQCGNQNVELHHEMVRSTVKDHFRKKLSDLDGFIIDEETGEVYMESTTVTSHISQIVHNEDVLTPLCPDCHRRRH